MPLLFYTQTNAFTRPLLLACIIAVAFAAKAQNTGEWYLSKILNDNNGLPQNSIRSMYYDTATNFLWLATEAGLVRYDGKDTRVFDKRDMPYLQSMRIHNLFPTVAGKVIGVTISGETFFIQQHYPQPEAVNHKVITEEITYRNGNVQSVAGLTMEAAALRTEKTTLDERSTILWLSDTSWIVSTPQSICLLHNSRVIHRWPRQTGLKLVLITRDKNVYAFDYTGVGYCLNVVSKTQTVLKVASPLLASGKARFFYRKLNDQPLLLYGNEVHEVIFNDNVLSTRLIAVLPKPSSAITMLAMDKTRRHLFVATSASGLFIYQVSSFRIYTVNAGDVYNTQYACVLTDSNHIFTCQSLLFDMRSGTAKKIPVALRNFRALAADTAGNIWGEHSEGIIRFRVDGKTDVLKIRLSDDYLHTLYRASNKQIWLSTFRHLNYIKADSLHRVLNYSEGALSLAFITETPNGEVIGLNNSGIFQVDTFHHQLIPVLVNAQLSQARFMMIDKDYRCWIATYGNGIFLYNMKTKKLTPLPVDDKGYLQYGHAFIEDDSGNFLVPCNKGLFRLSKRNLLQIEQDAGTPLSYQYFDVADGLLTNEFNGGCQPAYNRLPDGDIVVPALQGLVRVKIGELPDPSQNLLFVDGIETRINRYRLSDTLRFTSGERVQTWSLGFTQWDRPNMQGIFYRLDEDSTWQRLAVGEKQIRLSELKGGNHTLEIKHQYGLQPHQFTTLTCHFSVGKYYYETVWFWLAMAVLMAGIVYAAVRIRSRQLKQKNLQLQQVIRGNTRELSDKNVQLEETLMDLREALKGLRENSVFKDRLLGLIGHDMLLPLRFIARIANHLYDEAEMLSPELTRENGNEIKNTVTELLYLGESLIQWIKLQEGRFRLIVKAIELRQLTEEMMQVHKPMAAVKNNRLICAIPAGIFCRYDSVFLKVILHNLLLNANKFTEDGSITIDASVSNDELQFKVLDTGTGMNAAMADSLNKGITVPSQLGTNKEAGWGMGYLLILDLLRFAGGKLHVESELTRWTNVQFTLPLTIEEER